MQALNVTLKGSPGSVGAAFAELQSAVSDQMTLSKDANGKLSYVINKDRSGNPIKLSSDAQQLANAIDNHSFQIEVTADQFAKFTSKGNLMVGDAFMGSTVTQQIAIDPSGNTVNVIEAKQEINPTVLKTFDEANGKPGQSTLHAVTEAYQGAKIAQRTGMSIPAAQGNGTLDYAVAHKLAAPQSGEINEVRYDRYGTVTPGLLPGVTKSVEWITIPKNKSPVPIQRLK